MIAAMADVPPYWILISILFSNVSITPALASTLHQAALDLYRRNAGAKDVGGDVAAGRVKNLKKSLAFGAITGPAFEAELETARGKGRVTFLLTRQGLELMEKKGPPARSRPRPLPN
jgi:hypothetical protein